MPKLDSCRKSLIPLAVLSFGTPQASSRSAECAVGGPQCWTADLTAPYIHLVAENYQLDALDIRAASAPDEQTKQRPNGQVSEGEEPRRRYSKRAP